LGEVGNFVSGAHDRDDVGRWHAACQQVLNSKAAQVTGRAGDGVDGIRHPVTNCGEKAAA
jgi:hypothetical protein